MNGIPLKYTEKPKVILKNRTTGQTSTPESVKLGKRTYAMIDRAQLANYQPLFYDKSSDNYLDINSKREKDLKRSTIIGAGIFPFLGTGIVVVLDKLNKKDLSTQRLLGAFSMSCVLSAFLAFSDYITSQAFKNPWSKNEEILIYANKGLIVKENPLDQNKEKGMKASVISLLFASIGGVLGAIHCLKKDKMLLPVIDFRCVQPKSLAVAFSVLLNAGLYGGISSLLTEKNTNTKYLQ